MANAAPIVFTNGAFYYATSTGLAISGYNATTRVRETAFTIEADEHDVTAMGSNGWRARVAGLKSASFEITMYQDFESSSTGAGAIDARFFDLLNQAIPFSIEVRPFDAARSSDNPGYQATVRSFSHNPMNGAVGEVLMTPIRLLSAAGAVVRAVTSS